MTDDIVKPSKCSRCGHEWDYTGKLIGNKFALVTCPGCYRKAPLYTKEERDRL